MAPEDGSTNKSKLEKYKKHLNRFTMKVLNRATKFPNVALLNIRICYYLETSSCTARTEAKRPLNPVIFILGTTLLPLLRGSPK